MVVRRFPELSLNQSHSHDNYSMKRSGIAWSALLLAIVAAAGFFVAPYGYKQDWWSVTEVFKLILPLATLLALIALFLSVMGLGHSWFGTGRRGKLVSLLAIVVSVLTLYMPVTQFMRSQTLPPIHDVSTDITTPPPFEALLAERSGSSNSTEHGGEDVARQQLCAYPQLQSLVLNRLPEAVFPVAVKVAEQQDWQPILDDPVRGRIEAVDTSRWFGFKDDIVIRITAVEAGSQVDVRSVSRVGRSDLGVNAERVERYLRELAAALGVDIFER